MPFIPHTQEDVQRMLEVLDVASVDALFDEVPDELLCEALDVPAGISEMALLREMECRAAADFKGLGFLGAGAYEHHVPSLVWDIASRGEYMTAYTPYQAEASQGTLQLVYEYQSMMTALMDMEVSNASLYDGASALAEAILMAARCRRSVPPEGHRVLVVGTLNPRYLRVAETIVGPQGIRLEVLPWNETTLCCDLRELSSGTPEGVAALVIPLPNFFGQIEDVHALTDWAHRHHILVIAVVNPLAVAYFVPPGRWGETGADIAVGEGQPLGLPLSSGGPYFGFMCCRKGLVRQMPGRIIGRTVDLEGRTGFTLTLQAREQHIRRAKATSNICTNQGLAVTAATIHMALLGGGGLQAVARACMAGTQWLRARLAAMQGVTLLGEGPVFHEFVVRLPVDAARVVDALADRGILPGLALGVEFPAMRDCLLICVTETKTEADLRQLLDELGRVLAMEA